MGEGVPANPTLLFDGDCRLCRTMALMVSWWATSRGVRALPLQGTEARRLLPGWTDEEITRSAHLVLPDGRVLSGPRAFSALLDRLPALGPVHRRVGNRFMLPQLISTLYNAGVALRGAVQCATPPREVTA